MFTRHARPRIRHVPAGAIILLSLLLLTLAPRVVYGQG